VQPSGGSPTVAVAEPGSRRAARATPATGLGPRRRRPVAVPLPLVPLLAAVGLLAKLPELVLPMGTDQGIFATYARLMLQGGRPYVAFWDVHPPVVFVYWELVQRVAGADWAHSCGAAWGPLATPSCPSLAANCLDVFVTLVCGLLVYGTARRAGGSAGVGVGAAVLTVYFANISMLSAGGGVPAKLALAPMVLAVWALLWAWTGRGWMPSLLAGAAAALAVLAKQPALLTLVALGLIAAWYAWRSAAGPRWRVLAGYLLGAAGFLGLVSGWLIAVRSFAGFVEQAWVYNVVRVVAGNWHAAAEGLTAPSVFRLDNVTRDALAFLLVAAFAGALAIVSGPARPGQLAILWWTLANLLAIVGFREFIQLVPGMALLAAFGLGRLWAAAGRDGLGLGRPLAGRLVLVASFGTLFCLSSGFQVGQLRRAWYERGPAGAPAAVDVVAARVAQLPPGPLFVWGNAGQVYPLTGREPASRFMNAEALRLTAPGHERYRAELLADLASRPPSAIVLAPHVDEPELRVAAFPELGQLLQTCFEPVPLPAAAGHDWSVYVRRCDPKQVVVSLAPF